MSTRPRLVFRAAAAALLALYALVATWTLPGALDAAIDTWKTVAVGAFPCADHTCGCATVEECRAHCCCVPAPGAPKAPQAPGGVARVRVSLLSIAKCRGKMPAEGGHAGLGLAPHVPAPAWTPIAQDAPKEPRIDGVEERPREGSRRAVDKVPLAIG